MTRAKYLAAMAVLAALLPAAHARAADGKPHHKFATALYHFNLQYVAGNKAVEDRIITESFAPLVDFYEAHPGWGADFEMQGYMVEQLAARYPDVLAKFKALVDRGQVELVCFHYSDQLFIAYPRWDMDISIRLVNSILRENKIKRSGVVFTQEGQWSEDFGWYLDANRFSVAVLPKNLFRYYHKKYTAAPLYKTGKISVVLGGAGVEYEDEKNKLSVVWTFMDDGELLPTRRVTPYTPEFKYDPESMKKYEQELLQLEKNGFKPVTISQYVDALGKLGIAAVDLPPTPDGTWQPADTDNVFRWMGDYRFAHERDNDVLTRNFKARNLLYAVDALMFELRNRNEDVEALEPALFEAWRKQLLAEVSDSTGWNPAPEEIKYTLELNKEVMEEAKRIGGELKKIIGAKAVGIRIDPVAFKPLIETADAPAARPELEKTDCPIPVEFEGMFKSKQAECFKAGEERWEIRVRFETEKWYENNVRVVFPRTADALIYESALGEGGIKSHPFSEFDFESEHVYLPAPSGLIGLGDDLFLIRHNETVHLAWEVGVGAKKTVALRMSRPPNDIYEWTLTLVKGKADAAISVSSLINIFPLVWF